MRRLIALGMWIGLLALAAPRALAWSNKEHIYITRLAVERLVADPSTPPEMRQWLRQVTPDLTDLDTERQFFLHASIGAQVRGISGLSYWSTVPDERAARDPRSSTVAPFGVHERMLHFVDLELLVPDSQRRGYRHNLSGKPTLDQIPRDLHDPRWAQAGMLPFRVDDCYGKLVTAIRQGKLAPAPGDLDDNALRWAGYLAHYMADNTQPHHATADYKSHSYFADPATAPDIHAAMEYLMVDEPGDRYLSLRQQYWTIFMRALSEPIESFDNDDLWQATMQVSMASYDALPLIGLAAMQATGQGGTPEHPVGPHHELDVAAFYHYRGTYLGSQMSVMEMKAHQQAWAVQRIERIWRRAWDQAHDKPAATRAIQ